MPVHLHCWEPGPDAEDGCSTVCMLEDEHEGPHEFMRGDRIHIAFEEQNAEGKREGSESK